MNNPATPFETEIVDGNRLTTVNDIGQRITAYQTSTGMKFDHEGAKKGMTLIPLERLLLAATDRTLPTPSTETIEAIKAAAELVLGSISPSGIGFILDAQEIAWLKAAELQLTAP